MATPELPTLASERPGGWMWDRFLRAPLLLALGFCVYGMHWGVTQTRHADRLVCHDLLGGVAVGFVLANPSAIVSCPEFMRDSLHDVSWAHYHEGLEKAGVYGYGIVL